MRDAALSIKMSIMAMARGTRSRDSQYTPWDRQREKIGEEKRVRCRGEGREEGGVT
jgi:hypothetical protein